MFMSPVTLSYEISVLQLNRPSQFILVYTICKKCICYIII